MTSRLLLPFFFQAEDRIRYRDVTGVQTCALPIFSFTSGGYSGSLSSASGVASGPRGVIIEIATVAYIGLRDYLDAVRTHQSCDEHSDGFHDAYEDRKSVV